MPGARLVGRGAGRLIAGVGRVDSREFAEQERHGVRFVFMLRLDESRKPTDENDFSFVAGLSAHPVSGFQRII
jgi:hypothetical protein